MKCLRRMECFMEILYEELEKYHGRDIYPFHMPGHKRNREAVDFWPDLTEDITEIEGFDYLHHASGILRESQQAAARLYGADETYYSVNGSTGALLAAVSGCTSAGGAVLMARNCHQSVYHAVYLRQLDSYYLYPEIMAPYGINGAISPKQVEDALEAYGDVQAVLITSPTYDGVTSPVREIARIVHGHNLPLIVDEAHGAHFPFHAYFPESALEQGADVAVHSLHKTLPSLTQTALLHVKGAGVDRERIRRFMGIYQTSSPSYLLMGSMDACVRRLLKSGEMVFEGYVARLKALRQRLSRLQYITLAGEEGPDGHASADYDRSKLLLALPEGVSGPAFSQWLRKEWRLQMEMEAKTYVLGMTSAADTQEGFRRLCCALEDAEKKWQREGRDPGKKTKSASKGLAGLAGERVFSVGKALDMEKTKVPFLQSEGRVSAAFVYLYPPGIPLAVPGERITAQLLKEAQRFWDAGLEVRGLLGGRQRLAAVLRGC